MINKKNNQKQSYKKSSTLFMQLGLILALFISYSALELEMNYELPKISKSELIDNPDEQYIGKIEIIKNKPIVKPKKVVPKEVKPIKVEPKVVDKIKVVENTVKVTHTKLAPTEDNQNNVVKTITVETPIKVKEKTPTVLSSTFVQEMPTFPGCETENSFTAKKACFEEKIKKHIQKHFDSDLAQNLNLNEGKQRIKVQFVIDVNGNVSDIKTRAVHKKLEKEASRIIKKLPKMSPGKQNNKAVSVRYNVPINFHVEY